MTASIVPALIDTLIARCEAAPALADVTVHDYWAAQVDLGDSLFIGCDDPYNRSASTAGGGDQQWATFGARSRDGEESVTCAAVGWDTAGDMQVARDKVYAQLDVVQGLLDADPRLGLQGVIKAWVGDSYYRPLIDSTGATCLLVFEVRATVRLT